MLHHTTKIRAVGRHVERGRKIGTLAVAVAVAASVTLGVAPSAAQAQSLQQQSVLPDLEQNQAEWIPADLADTDAAQGGSYYLLMVGAAGLFIKVCGGTKIDGCARGAVKAFTTYKAATSWTCKKYGRLC